MMFRDGNVNVAKLYPSSQVASNINIDQKIPYYMHNVQTAKTCNLHSDIKHTHSSPQIKQVYIYKVCEAFSKFASC